MQDKEPELEALGEDFNTEEFFKPGWETLEAKSAFFQPYFQRMVDDGYIMREVRGQAAKRVPVVDAVTHEPRDVLMFGSNNYLGFASEDEIKDKVIDCVRKYGIGCGGPPLLNGTTELHRELERRLAELKGTQDSLLYSSGYAANVGWCSALLARKDILVYDVLSHASLIDGIRMSRFDAVSFAHNDMNDLRKRLMQVRYKSPYRNIIVCVEGVYSMDGDIAPLPEILALCKKYNALLCIDDAHGTGVLGETGRGTAEHFGLEGQIHLQMGTFSKTFAVNGGFVAGSRDLCDYLRFFSRSFMFSATLPPMVVTAVLAGIDFLLAHPERVHRLRANAKYFVERLAQHGVRASCKTAIIPIGIPEHVHMRDLVRRLHSEGLFVNGISYPAVPPALQRLRLSMMATFTEADLDFAAETLGRVLREMGAIK